MLETKTLALPKVSDRWMLISISTTSNIPSKSMMVPTPAMSQTGLKTKCCSSFDKIYPISKIEKTEIGPPIIFSSYAELGMQRVKVLAQGVRTEVTEIKNKESK
jgi:hypothetical protein